MHLRLSTACVLAAVSLSAFADSPPGQRNFRQHDPARPQPRAVAPGPAVSTPPPADAVVLLGGADDAKHWSNAKWAQKGGVMRIVPGAKDQASTEAFGDCQLHVEFDIPVSEKAKRYPNRGNSGVFLMGKYEVQVYGSWPGDEGIYADGIAGAVYGQNPPLVNALRPAGEWNAYDIVFHRPRFDDKGACVKKATVTVFLNGALVQDGFALSGPTTYMHPAPYAKHADKLPLVLQEHGSVVAYRNIWVRELE